MHAESPEICDYCRQPFDGEIPQLIEEHRVHAACGEMLRIARETFRQKMEKEDQKFLFWE